MDLYTKINGSYVPIEVTDVISKDYDGKMVWVRVGNDRYPASESEIRETNEGLNDYLVSDIFGTITFVVTNHQVKIEVLSDISELKNKHLTVQVSGADLSSVNWLQKDVIKQLKGVVRDIHFLPAPLTLKEYQEVMQIKKRSDLRKKRRGN